MKRFGRIGSRGRTLAEHYDDEALALAALQKQAVRKQQKGYRTTAAKTLDGAREGDLACCE